MAQKTTKDVPVEVVEAARAAAIGEAAAPRPKERLTTMEATAKLNYVEPGSEAHERRLTSAYAGLTRELSEQIIRERDKDPLLWPWDRYQEAKSFLKELDGKPKPVSTKPHWTRDQV